MSDAVHWLLALNIKEGELDTFKALVKEMVDATKADEPGAQIYEWFVSDDEKTCHIYERYADSAATMTHLAAFGQNFAERFMAVLEPVQLVVYGNPSDEVRGALAAFGAVHMSQFAGFAR